MMQRDFRGQVTAPAVRFAALALAAAWFATPASAATVQQFSPQGMVKDVRQVTARFSTAMVALGDPQLPDPFAVDCAASGHGRWADTRNWVYDFDDDLPAGLVCRFSLKDGLRAQAGDAVNRHEGLHVQHGRTCDPRIAARRRVDDRRRAGVRARARCTRYRRLGREVQQRAPSTTSPSASRSRC
jgi:hypothetical protein